MTEPGRPIDLATWFHPYGFHREKGTFPGTMLNKKLHSLFDSKKQDLPLEIHLDGMKTLHGSFFDGAFGEFIDRYKDNFFDHFKFVTTNNRYITTISTVLDEHRQRNFNQPKDS